MFIKTGIFVGIIILGGMIFAEEIDSLFPSTSASVTESIKDDVSNFSDKASTSVEKRIDKSIDKIVDKTTDSISTGIDRSIDKIANKTSSVITNEISEIKESSQKTISEKIIDFNPIESITNIFTNDSNSQSPQELPNNSVLIIDPIIIQDSTQNQSQVIHETLSLSTSQQSNDDIALQYSDSSGKTNSVNVIIRTDQKEIFSGTFFTSMFKTDINDISGVPYYVDMIIDHEEYGMVSSSVFNPGDYSDSNINGIFSQS